MIVSPLLTRRVFRFRRFFEMGQEESASPFLSEEGKKVAKNLSLKVSSCSALLLFLAYLLSFLGMKTLLPFLVSLVFLLVGSPSLIAALEDIFVKKESNIDVLMTLAAFGAVLVGYPLEGALLLVLFELSESLEDVVTLRAKQSIVSLGELNPENALCLEKNGQFMERALEDVPIGSIILVRMGEVVPLDGTIVAGEATLSLAHMTGEAHPILFREGEAVCSGARVVEGAFQIKTNVTMGQSTLSNLIHLITRVHQSKPHVSQFLQRHGKRYTLFVIAFSLFLLFSLPLLFGFPFLGEMGSFKRAMTFLITASPCALILAVPISYVSALGSALREGAVLKGGVVFDQLLRCKTVAFDKTGTLTYGTPEVVEFQKITGTIEEKEALSLLASLEQYSTHPSARAVVEYARQHALLLFPCQRVVVETGRGIRGEIQKGEKTYRVLAGSFHFVQENYPAWRKEEKVVALPGESELFFSIDGTDFFACRVKDALRSEGQKAIGELKKMKKNLWLISGDKEEVVQEIAWRLGIDKSIAEATPKEKVERVELLDQDGLAMVGDGLNDAPALARATVGISMGSVSSASAREVSDVILLHDNLKVIPWLFMKASTTRTILLQNLVVATLAILGGVLFSLFGILPVWGAVCIHEGSTLLVGLNGLRLLK